MRNAGLLNYKVFQKLQDKTTDLRAAHGAWENLGPFDYFVGDVYSSSALGRVNCTAFHPNDNTTFWVGTPAGGLWKTTDSGTSWSPMTDGFASIGVSAIAVNPTNADILYVLTGDGDGRDSPSIGIMKTTNGGYSWNSTALSWGTNQNVYGYKLLIDPENSQVLLAAMSNGIWRTSNGGTSWTQVTTTTTTDLEFSPNNSDIIYATTQNRIDSAWVQARFHRSINNGINWAEESDPAFPDTSSRAAIAISPSAPENVYVVFGGANVDAGTFRGLLKSIDYGGSFTLQSTTPNILDPTLSGDSSSDQASYDICIVVDPQDDSHVFVGGINMWKSEDDGVTWGRETWWTRNYAPSDPFVHADWHNIYFRGSTLFANTDGGIYITNDYGNSWTELSSGLCTMQFYQIDVLNTSYVGGTQDNGTNESDFTDPQCNNILGGDGFGAVWHSGDNSIQFLTTQNCVARRQLGSNVTIWEEQDGFWFTDIKMHTTNLDYLFLNKGNELFRGNQDGFIWNFNWDSLNTNTLLVDQGIRGFIQGSSGASNVMYVVAAKRIIKTTDLGSSPPSWDTLPNPVSGIVDLSDIMISPTNSNKVWISTAGFNASNKLFYSSNGGMDWTNITGSFPDVPIRCITYEPQSNDGLYVGTDVGIFYMNADMSDWIYFSTYLPNVPVHDIVVYNGEVVAGTHGRGIWKSQAYSCPFNLTLTPANDPVDPLNIGRQEFNVANVLSSTRTIQGTSADIYYTAGNYIDLKVGFWSKTGGQMQSVIGDCPD
jgi:photosystem II stability/assembly factor-like uncharacterized protein